MAWPMRSFLFFIGLPVLGIGALTMYLWHKKLTCLGLQRVEQGGGNKLHRRLYGERLSQLESINKPPVFKKSWQLLNHEEEDWSEIRGLNITERDVRISHEAVAMLVGRDGCNFQAIQEKTNTKLSLRDGESHLEYTTCRIIGKGDNVLKAVDMVMEIINSHEAKSHFSMWVPSTAIGRIIGRCGETVRALSKQSGARIQIDKRQQNHNVGQKTLISISGSDEQIKMAVSLIEQKVKEDEVARDKLHLALNTRKSGVAPVQTPGYEKLLAAMGDNMLQEVYISAIASPTRFWVQVITPRAAELDHMLENMTDYYSKEENRTPIMLDEVQKGQIVACNRDIDNKWYRVEIVQVEKRNEPPEDSLIDVFNVDYGESEYVPLKSLCYLQTEYLSLRFQAIEVEMVGIAPCDGVEWPEEAIDAFSELTKVGHWHVMMAEVVGYKTTDKVAGVPLPCIRLYDPDGPPGVDLGQQMIQLGMAAEVPIEGLSPRYEVSSKDDEPEW